MIIIVPDITRNASARVMSSGPMTAPVILANVLGAVSFCCSCVSFSCCSFSGSSVAGELLKVFLWKELGCCRVV